MRFVLEHLMTVWMDKYHALHEMISKRMSMERYTTSLQRDYQKHFYMYTFVIWDRDLECLKEIVNRGYPRYTEGGRAKLSDYHNPFRHLWDDSMIHSYPGPALYEKDFNSNKPQWRPKKKHNKNELAAIDYYDKGLKRLVDEEKMLRERLEKKPNSIDSQMDLNILRVYHKFAFFPLT